MTRDLARKAGQPAAAFCEAHALEAVSIWTTGSSGGSDIRPMLENFVKRLGAGFASIVRIDRKRPSVHDAIVRSGRLGGRQAEMLSFSRLVCGQYLEAARPGTIWHSQLDELPIDLAPARSGEGKLVDILVTPLAPQAGFTDFLEIGYARALEAMEVKQMTLLGPVLAQAWQNRNVGCFMNANLESRLRPVPRTERRVAKPAPPKARPALSMENPFRFSRAEFRVCLLMARGLRRMEITRSLGISASTLRTHLRNIYAKTETHSEADLLRLLVVPPTPDGRFGVHVA